ncbi:MAG: hypothetical protein RSE62_03600 [Citrobacter sp.]
MLNGEQKQFKLRPARQPATIAGMHNTVVVYGGAVGPISYGHVSFDPSLIRAVGLALPQGVSTHNPAFLQVHFDTKKQHWVVSACYVLRDVQHALWVSIDFPVWLKTLKRVGETKHVTARTQDKNAYSNPRSSTGNRARLAA